MSSTCVSGIFRALLPCAVLVGSTLGCASLSISDVRLNQVGYLPQASKLAVVQSAERQPLPWQLVDAAGSVVARGNTQPRGADEESGDVVQWADFSSFTRPGQGYRLIVQGEESFPFSIDARVYLPLKKAAFNYFDQNRSGTPI